MVMADYTPRTRVALPSAAIVALLEETGVLPGARERPGVAGRDCER